MSIRPLPPLSATQRPEGLQSFISDGVKARWNASLAPRALADDDDVTTLSILEPIGADFYEGGVTTKRVAAVLRAAEGRDVVVDLNSPGGDLFEGIAIYNQLREYSGRVTVRVIGIAASVASVIAMAGDRIEIGDASFLMVHNSWVVAMGDRKALREIAATLEPFDAALAEVYAKRSGQDVKTVARMLDAETWINGRLAVEQGFADALLSADAVDSNASKSPSALRRVENHLKVAGLSRSQCRAILAALKTEFRGMHDAAADDKPRAVATLDAEVSALAQTLMLKAFGLVVASKI